MFKQLLFGSLMIGATLIVMVVFIAISSHVLNRSGAWLKRGSHLGRLAIALAAITLWILLGLSIGVWIWAYLFYTIDAFQGFETCLYFAVVSFTTLGYGDVVLPTQWRLLAGLVATNGLLLFGLSTAYLVEFIVRLRGELNRV